MLTGSSLFLCWWRVIMELDAKKEMFQIKPEHAVSVLCRAGALCLLFTGNVWAGAVWEENTDVCPGVLELGTRFFPQVTWCVTWVRTLAQLLGIHCPFRPKWQEAKRQYQVFLFLKDVLKHGCLNSPMMCNTVEKLWRTESNFFIIAGSDKLQ